ncbi:MAG TPA: methyltransferase domain-containing protein [Nitrososphaerales archaeon]|nr:methyltransferase domain-containing protein [Nitrososphaerales archaeon]
MALLNSAWDRFPSRGTLSASEKSYWMEFLSMLAPGSGEKILDIGAGDCSKAAKVLEASPGAEVYAVDPNEKRIAAARRQRPQVKSSVAGAECLPFPDSHFDKAYSTMALHHFTDMDKALGEVTRVLRPGGLYVILEVEPHSVFGRLFRFFGGLMGEKMQIMSQDQLLARLKQVAGLQVTNSAGFGSTYLVRLARA